MAGRAAYTNIDEYIATFPEDVQAILQEFRRRSRKLLPDAQEKISYGIPTLYQAGNVIHFAAFKQHIGLFPPVQADAQLQLKIARYQGPKGNLQFPLKEPMPWPLITQVLKQLVASHHERLAMKQTKKKKPTAKIPAQRPTARGT